MEPAIQFATTSGDVNIAFWARGNGPPLVLIFPPGFSNLRYEWQIPEGQRTFELNEQHFTVVRYDLRNTGLSDRGVAEVSLEDYVSDLEAVLEKLQYPQVSIFGDADAGKIAIAYAARHPDRVSSLILWRTNPAPGGSAAAPGWTNLRPLLDHNWPLFTDLLATALAGLDDTGLTARVSHYIRESVLPKEFVTASDSLAAADVSALLPHIEARTLVLHRMDTPFFAIERARKLVATIPDARLAVIQGKSPFAWDENVIRAGLGFLLEDQARPAARSSAIRTMLYTDVESHTAMMQRLGDSAGRDVLRQHEHTTRQALRDFGGSEIKAMGDGFLASFSSAQKALECAVALQRAFAVAPSGAGEAGPLRVRIGVNAGEPIAEDGDLFGAAVIAAARIAGKAAGGEILVSHVVRELAAGKGFLFASRGETRIRGLEDPIQLFELLWQTSPARLALPD